VELLAVTTRHGFEPLAVRKTYSSEEIWKKSVAVTARQGFDPFQSLHIRTTSWQVLHSVELEQPMPGRTLPRRHPNGQQSSQQANERHIVVQANGGLGCDGAIV
jgi:hypothetical protein